MITKPLPRIKCRRGKEYTEWRADYVARHPGPHPCAGVWKQGAKVSDCQHREQGTQVGHKRGRSTHFGAPAKMTDDGVIWQCGTRNAISAGNRVLR